jgi:hypothetical protein
MTTADQIPVTRVAGGEGRRWERQEGNKPHLFEALDGEIGGPKRLADGGREPAAGAGGGGGAPLRKRVQGQAVQLRGEAEKVVGVLFWAMWGLEWCVHARVTARRSGCWGGELRVSSGAFIGARWRMAAWPRAAGEGPTRGKTKGVAASLAPAGLTMAAAAPAAEENRRVEASRGGGRDYVGQHGISRCW